MNWRDRLEARLDFQVSEQTRRWCVFGAVMIVCFIAVIMGLEQR